MPRGPRMLDAAIRQVLQKERLVLSGASNLSQEEKGNEKEVAPPTGTGERGTTKGSQLEVKRAKVVNLCVPQKTRRHNPPKEENPSQKPESKTCWCSAGSETWSETKEKPIQLVSFKGPKVALARFRAASQEPGLGPRVSECSENGRRAFTEILEVATAPVALPTGEPGEPEKGGKF